MHTHTHASALASLGSLRDGKQEIQRCSLRDKDCREARKRDRKEKSEEEGGSDKSHDSWPVRHGIWIKLEESKI